MASGLTGADIVSSTTPIYVTPPGPFNSTNMDPNAAAAAVDAISQVAQSNVAGGGAVYDPASGTYYTPAHATIYLNNEPTGSTGSGNNTGTSGTSGVGSVKAAGSGTTVATPGGLASGVADIPVGGLSAALPVTTTTKATAAKPATVVAPAGIPKVVVTPTPVPGLTSAQQQAATMAAITGNSGTRNQPGSATDNPFGSSSGSPNGGAPTYDTTNPGGNTHAQIIAAGGPYSSTPAQINALLGTYSVILPDGTLLHQGSTYDPANPGGGTTGGGTTGGGTTGGGTTGGGTTPPPSTSSGGSLPSNPGLAAALSQQSLLQQVLQPSSQRTAGLDIGQLLSAIGSMGVGQARAASPSRGANDPTQTVADRAQQLQQYLNAANPPQENPIVQDAINGVGGLLSGIVPPRYQEPTPYLPPPTQAQNYYAQSDVIPNKDMSRLAPSGASALGFSPTTRQVSSVPFTAAGGLSAAAPSVPLPQPRPYGGPFNALDAAASQYGGPFNELDAMAGYPPLPQPRPYGGPFNQLDAAAMAPTVVADRAQQLQAALTATPNGLSQAAATAPVADSAPTPMDRYHLTPTEAMQRASDMMPNLKLNPTGASPQDLQSMVDAMPSLENIQDPNKALQYMQDSGMMGTINKILPGAHQTNFGDRALGAMGGVTNLPPVIPDLMTMKAFSEPGVQDTLSYINTLGRRPMSASDGVTGPGTGGLAAAAAPAQTASNAPYGGPFNEMDAAAGAPPAVADRTQQLQAALAAAPIDDRAAQIRASLAATPTDDRAQQIRDTLAYNQPAPDQAVGDRAADANKALDAIDAQTVSQGSDNPIVQNAIEGLGNFLGGVIPERYQKPSYEPKSTSDIPGYDQLDENQRLSLLENAPSLPEANGSTVPNKDTAQLVPSSAAPAFTPDASTLGWQNLMRAPESLASTASGPAPFNPNAVGTAPVTRQVASVPYSVPPIASTSTDSTFNTDGQTADADGNIITHSGDTSKQQLDAAIPTDGAVTDAQGNVIRVGDQSGWDKTVSGAGKALSHTGLGAAISHLFPQQWNDMGRTIANWGDSQGASTVDSGFGRFSPMYDATHNSFLDAGQRDHPAMNTSGGGLSAAAAPTAPPPSNGGGGTTTPPPPGMVYDRFGRLVFPGPSYRPGVDPEWLYYRSANSPDGPAYAQGGVVSPAVSGLPMTSGLDPRIGTIMEAEDALTGQHDNPNQALKTFVDSFGQDALQKLVEQTQRGLTMRNRQVQQAAQMAPAAPRMVQGPGTGTSDSIPAMIDGSQPAKLSDGEFVMTADAVKNAGGGDPQAGARRLMALNNQLARRRNAA